MTQAFVTYTAYVGLLYAARKARNSERADQIRDAMDPLWQQLTPEEAETAGKISAAITQLDPS